MSPGSDASDEAQTPEAGARHEEAALRQRLRRLVAQVTDLVAGRDVDLLADLGAGDEVDQLALAIHVLWKAAPPSIPPTSASAPQPSGSRRADVPHAHPSRRLRVLVVDDDPNVRSVTGELLEAAGFAATVLPGPHEAVDWFADPGHPAPDLLLVDMTMPGLTGPQLVDRVADRLRDVAVVFMTGYLDPDQADALRARHQAQVLRKPFTLQELVSTLRDAHAQGPGA